MVYQRSFLDNERPSSLPPNVPFEPRVWLIPRSFRGPSRPKAPKNAFHATRFYNLSTDDPRQPVVEDALSRLEDRFGAVIPKLKLLQEPSLRNFIDLAYFIGSLQMRTPAQVDHWQRQYDEIAAVHRAVERARTGSEVISDGLFGIQSDMSRRHLLERAEAYARVIAPGGWLIANSSPLPFLSSDQPAVHTFLHRDQLEATGFPATVLHPEAMPSHRAFFCYCPLTPALAFVSSPLLDPPSDTTYFTTSSPQLVVGLNEIVRSHAHEYLISHREDPYGPLAHRLADLDDVYAATLRERGSCGALVYTDDSRYWFACDSVRHEDGPHPLFGHSVLVLRDPADIDVLPVGTILREVEMYERGQQTSGLRGARLHSVTRGSPATLTIQADPSLAI